MLSKYIKTLEKVEKIDFDYMIQGHSNAIYRKNIIYDYIDVAKNPDWEKGKIRKNTLTSGYDALVKIVMSKNYPKLNAKLVIGKIN